MIEFLTLYNIFAKVLVFSVPLLFCLNIKMFLFHKNILSYKIDVFQ